MTATIIEYKIRRRSALRLARIALALVVAAIAVMSMACTSKPSTALVPVAVPPAKVTLPPRPVYATASIQPDATTQQRLFWMAQDFGACRAAEESYRVLLGPFVTNPDENIEGKTNDKKPR